ncbi:MAG: hypothetical protein JJ979_17290 [Roseibium sp.]|nr:hypothetical protein [Roseibium sp.]
MAIKLNGTTVIDNSRNLVGIGSGSVTSTTVSTSGSGKFYRMPNSKLDVSGGKLRLNIVEEIFNCDATAINNCSNCNCDCNCDCDCRC